MSASIDAILQGSDAGQVGDSVAELAGTVLDQIERSLPGALAGDRQQVHLYVDAYRRLTEEILATTRDARPRVAWFRAALDQSAMSAPFTDWVGLLGVGRGTAVALVALVRDALPDLQPLAAAPGRRLPDWELDSHDVLRFQRAVVDELELEEMPLERIRAMLGMSRTELAALFGVKRQALDHWEANGVPADRLEKLATIEGIADLLAAKLKRERVPGVVRRSASAYGGRSALDAIAAGNQDLVLAELRDAFDWTTAA